MRYLNVIAERPCNCPPMFSKSIILKIFGWLEYNVLLFGKLVCTIRSLEVNLSIFDWVVLRRAEEGSSSSTSERRKSPIDDDGEIAERKPKRRRLESGAKVERLAKWWRNLAGTQCLSSLYFFSFFRHRWLLLWLLSILFQSLFSPSLFFAVLCSTLLCPPIHPHHIHFYELLRAAFCALQRVIVDYRNSLRSRVVDTSKKKWNYWRESWSWQCRYFFALVIFLVEFSVCSPSPQKTSIMIHRAHERALFFVEGNEHESIIDEAFLQ